MMLYSSDSFLNPLMLSYVKILYNVPAQFFTMMMRCDRAYRNGERTCHVKEQRR